jgi:hydroxyacylglutathione hydrolase
MIMYSIEAGPVDTRGYIVADPECREALIIDVPLESRGYYRRQVEEQRLTVKAIILTHGHFDHVGDVASLARDLGAPVLIHELDAPQLEEPAATFPGLQLQIEGMRTEDHLAHGDVIECGRLRLRVIHAPGHTPGHVVLYEMREGVLFSGDVLFHGSIGRTDLPGGDYDALMQSITKRLLALPEDTVVYPGHGERTTIGYERAHNPFILEYLEHY